MNNNLTKISTFGKQKITFIAQSIIVLFAFVILLSIHDSTGTGLFFVGFIILAVYFVFIFFKAKKYVSIYRDKNEKYLLKKIFPLTKTVLSPVESIEVNKITFLSIYKVIVIYNGKRKVYFTYSYEPQT